MKKQRFTIELDVKQVTTLLLIVSFIFLGFILGANRQNIIPFFTNPAASIFQVSGTNVSARQLKGMLKKKDFTFINVHVPYEGEIEKTDTFVPYDQIVANSASLPKEKNTPIILYCKTGRMSGEAIETLKKMGYTNVRHLAGGMDGWKSTGNTIMDLRTIEESVLPKNGITLSVSWGDIGPKLVAAGVIDLPKFKEAVKLTSEQEKILTQGSSENIRIDAGNSQFVVDVLWALGLAQKSIVYDEGPLGKEYKNEVGNFASTGGWTLARGDATQYLNRFDFISLTPDQQKRVGDIAKNVYRPCCGNSAWFPDCNHGMAALAAIELMVSLGMDEKTIYREVLALNSFWFSQTYLTTATYFARQGVSWDKVDAKEVLGEAYSSGKGASELAKKVGPLPYKPQQGGGACGA